MRAAHDRGMVFNRVLSVRSPTLRRWMGLAEGQACHLEVSVRALLAAAPAPRAFSALAQPLSPCKPNQYPF